MSVEAGVTLGWERYVGTEGVIIGTDRFGESGDGEAVKTKLGISAQRIADDVRRMLEAYEKRPYL
jgi:transketolase